RSTQESSAAVRLQSSCDFCWPRISRGRVPMTPVAQNVRFMRLPVVIFSTVIGARLTAQMTTVVSATSACKTCRIELVKRVTLGTETDTISPSDFETAVARDSRGRYLVVPIAGNTSFAVYDAGGRLLRTVGRAGSGPGEYEWLNGA